MKKLMLVLLILLCGCSNENANISSELVEPIEKDMNEVSFGDVKCIPSIHDDEINLSFTSSIIDTYDSKNESDMESLFQILSAMDCIFEGYKESNYFKSKGYTLDESCSFEVQSEKHKYNLYLDSPIFQSLDIDNETIYVFWLDTMAGNLYTGPDPSHMQHENIDIPYIGMDEMYINDTLCGPYGKKEEKPVGQGKNIYFQNKYIWYAKNGYDIPLIVTCEDGKVIKVYKYFETTTRVYWNSDGTPNFDRNYESNKEYVDTPDYDVQDYDDPYDFWLDHDTDFEDYEEAEDYWFDWN